MNSFSDATEQPPCNVSSNYHHYSDLATHNLGLSDTNLTNSSSFTPVQGFHHDQLQEEPHLVNDHKSELYVCKWLDGHNICGRTIDANKIPEHMCTYHLEPPKRASHSSCQWEGCQRLLSSYRRDTIIRHIREVHLGIPRPKSSASVTRGAIARPRLSRKKAHTN